MSDVKKPIRLVDVGELEADLKKDLAEEEAKGEDADILFCESISDALGDLSNLPTIDPESLRPVARCTRLTFNGKPIGFQCSNCKGITAGSIGGFCTHCGANWGESYDELDL